MAARESEKERLLRLSEFDRRFVHSESSVLAGMDEVGRGPLAGPVVVCCAVMPKAPLVEWVNDSKKVSEKRRELLYDRLTQVALEYKTAWIVPEVIDEINILEATRRGFREAFCSMRMEVSDVLIDAVTGLELSARQHTPIHGDALSYSIACASIIAKVERDRYMRKQDELYPEYGFAKNKGYGTAEHIAALKKYGPCPIHRKSFIRKFV